MIQIKITEGQKSPKQFVLNLYRKYVKTYNIPDTLFKRHVNFACLLLSILFSLKDHLMSFIKVLIPLFDRVGTFLP